jgi:hypothetical protein
MVPWDLELTYGNTSAFSLPGTPASTYTNFFTEVERMINRPRIKRLYYGILAEQVNAATGFFHSAFLAPYMQQLAGAGVGRTEVGTGGGFIDSRAGMIRGWIQGSIYPQVRLRITTNGGEDFASGAPAIDLAGNAPADVFFLAVLVNGEEPDPAPEQVFSTADMTGWTVKAIPIGSGVNSIEVLGLGSEGNIIDADSIRVISSADWNLPAITRLDPVAAAAGSRITITGSDFHTGLKVFFGTSQATGVAFEEAADPYSIAVTVPPGLAVGTTGIKVRNLDNQDSNLVEFTVLPTFLRGDGNLDGQLDLSDALKVLLHLFTGVPASCLDALDGDDSGTLDTTDAIRILGYLFQDGPPPAAPFPDRGLDATDDPLDCQQGPP